MRVEVPRLPRIYKCRYFDTCGGCSIQHIDSTAQIAFKQRIMEEQLERIGKIRPKQILPAIYGTPWHYRERARLSISKDAGGRLKIGFKAKKSHEVIDVDSCMVLPAHISEKLPKIKQMLQSLIDLDLLFINRGGAPGGGGAAGLAHRRAGREGS